MTLKSALLPWLLGAAALAGAEPAPQPIQIWVSSQTDLKYYQEMVTLYREQVDKNFTADVHAYGFTEMPNKLAVAIKSGINTPDLVQLDEIFFSLYLRGEVPFVDLTDRLQQSPISSGMVPQRMNLFRWQGRIYGVPQSLSAVVLWYRQDLFQQLKISPDDINTWDKFEAVGRRIRSDNHKLIALDWSYLEILLRQRGYDLFGPDGKLFTDSAVIVDTWNKLRTWQQDSIGFVPDRASIFDPAFYTNYAANNSVLTLMGPDWFGLDILQNMDPKHKGLWRAMPLPIWTDSVSKSRRNTSCFSGQGLMIFKKSRHIDASWKFMEWVMTDVDANVQRYLEGNCFPAYKPAWTDLRFSRKDPYFGNQDLSELFMDISSNLPSTTQSPLHAMVVNMLRESYFIPVVRQTALPSEAIRTIIDKIAQMSAAKKP